MILSLSSNARRPIQPHFVAALAVQGAAEGLFDQRQIRTYRLSDRRDHTANSKRNIGGCRFYG